MKRRARGRPFGPYLPLIMEACGEDEFAYEYRHGVTSYGAFTYALSTNLRRYKRITFEKLVHETADQLAGLGYEQKPNILGPRAVIEATVPWLKAKG